MALENFKLTANRIQFGVQGTVTANQAQSMEQECRFDYQGNEITAHLYVSPRRGILTIQCEKMSKIAIQELINNCTLLKGKKYNGFTVSKQQVTSDFSQLEVIIDFL